MKYLLIIAAVLPLLASCTLEEGYDDSGYYPSVPRAYVERPNTHGHGHHRSRDRHYQSGQEIIVTTPDSYRGRVMPRNHAQRAPIIRHGHRNNAPGAMVESPDTINATAGHGHKNTPPVAVIENNNPDFPAKGHGHD